MLYGGGLLQPAAMVKNGFCGLLADGSCWEDISVLGVRSACFEVSIFVWFRFFICVWRTIGQVTDHSHNERFILLVHRSWLRSSAFRGQRVIMG